jgi:hypothetical protein
MYSHMRGSELLAIAVYTTVDHFNMRLSSEVRNI